MGIMTRRHLLALPLGLLLPIRQCLAAREQTRIVLEYEAEIGILFDIFSFSLSGSVVEEIDHDAGRYRVTITGQGAGVVARTEASGIIRGGRFMPREMRSTQTIRGRENWVTVAYDYDRNRVEYHSVSYTLLLGRRRQGDDVLPLPAGQPVDDLISAALNFAADALERGPDGAYRTLVVRRARPDNEAPDDVSAGGYRAELVPLRFQVTPEGAAGRLAALVDITRFSSWARSDRPARVTFTPERHVASVRSSLILGTTVSLRLSGVA